MTKQIISKNEPNEEGEDLWCVHYMCTFKSTHYLERNPIPFDGFYFVLAKSHDEAVAKAKPGIDKSRYWRGKDKDVRIEAAIFPLEKLLPVRSTISDGSRSRNDDQIYSSVGFANENDAKRYRLGVCLIPIE